MKRLSLALCAAVLLTGCASNLSKSSVSDRYMDLQYREDALLDAGMIYYGHDPDAEAFDDMYYAFAADEEEMNEEAARQLKDFKEQVGKLSKDDRAFLKYVFTDYADLADMANYAYKDSEVILPEGWQDLGAADPALAELIGKYSSSGLKCSLMAKGDRRVLVFAGTDFPSSWTSPKQVIDFVIDAYEDVYGALNEDASQVVLARGLVDGLLSGGYVTLRNLEFAGHSLGGRLASQMSVRYGCPAVIFNAAGVSPEVYESYESARKTVGKNWRGYIVDVIAANDPLTCAQKYMSGASDPFVSTAAKAMSVDKRTAEGIFSLAGAVVNTLAGDSDIVNSVKGLASGIMDEYYDRDYRALGAKMPVREDMAGHGIKELAAALRIRADLCK